MTAADELHDALHADDDPCTFGIYGTCDILDEIRAVQQEAIAAPWKRLRAELKDMEAWYLSGGGAYVHVGASIYHDPSGSFDGGVFIDADRLSRDEWGDDPLVVDGHTLDEVVDGLVAAMRQYRADRDRERAEMAAEDCPQCGGQGWYIDAKPLPSEVECPHPVEAELR